MLRQALARHPLVGSADVAVDPDGRPGTVTVIPRQPDAGGLEPAPRVTRLPAGLCILDPHPLFTRGMYGEIFLGQTWTACGLTIDQGARIIDAGANIGLFSLYCLMRAPTCQVVAVEPLPPTYVLLARNLDLPGARTIDAGLGGESGSAEFVHYPLLSGISGRSALPVESRMSADRLVGTPTGAVGPGVRAAMGELLGGYYRCERHRCRLMTLAEVLDTAGFDEVDFLKVDIEGSELAALAALPRAEWRRIAQVAVEAHAESAADSLAGLLSDEGFATLVVPPAPGAARTWMLAGSRRAVPRESPVVDVTLESCLRDHLRGLGLADERRPRIVVAAT